MRRRGFQPAGAQRRPPALPVQPLQRDEEADRGGRAAVLARDVQGGWAAPLAASVATPPPPNPGLRRAVGKRGGRWRGGRAAVSLSVGWAPRPGSVGKGFQPSPLRHVHLQPPVPSCPPASSPVVPARPSVTALGARSSGFSAAQSSGVQVWCLLLSGPLGQGLAACGLNGAGL